MDVLGQEKCRAQCITVLTYLWLCNDNSNGWLKTVDMPHMQFIAVVDIPVKMQRLFQHAGLESGDAVLPFIKLVANFLRPRPAD